MAAPGSEDEQQTETAAPPELTPGGPVQIRPDEGSPVAGAEVNAPFDIGRRLQISASINGGYDDNCTFDSKRFTILVCESECQP